MKYGYPATAPSVTGYKDHAFDGWSTDFSSIKGNLTVEARYSSTVLTVTFEPNGGSVDPTSKTFHKGDKYGGMPTPSREGYTGSWWWTNSSGGERLTESSEVTLTGSQTLYAHWTANQYTVTFDANGGSVGQESKQVTFDGSYGTLPTPTRRGYSFDGWFTTESGSIQVDSGTKVTTAENLKLWAHWTEKVYTLTLDRQGGEGGSVSAEARIDEDLPEITVPTRTGYRFNGYFADTNGGGKQYYDASGVGVAPWEEESNRTVYAYWTKEEYEVTLDPRGGSGGTASVTAKYDESMPTIVAPAWEGYQFDGYYELPDGQGKQYYSKTGVGQRNWDKTENATLYAKWTLNSYTVAFDSNGATNWVKTQTMILGDTHKRLDTNEYAKVGYTFIGWADSQTNALALKVEYKDGQQIERDLAKKGETNTIYAVWNTNAYYIAFAANGGTGSAPATKKAFYDQPWNLPKNTFVAPEHYDYEFAGWDFDRTATEPTFGDQEKVVNLCAENGKTNTLYAIWKFLPSEISEVLDCDNLYFKKTKGSTEWTIVATNCGHHGVGPDSMRHIGENGFVFAEAESSGTLSFCWSGETKKTGGIVNKARLVLSVDETVLETFEAVQDMKWSNVTVRIEHRTEGPVRIEFSHSGTSVGVYLDHVTWIPDGGEPTYAEDDTPVTGFSMADGRIGFSFAADGSSTYHILGTNDVTAPWPWPFVREVEAGETQPVQIDIKANEPKMFYRIRALQ